MKKIISLAIIIAVLSGCAARDENNQIIHNPDGSEKISWGRTAALIIGAPVLILGMAAMAKDGGGSAPANTYQGNCQYDWQIAADGSRCGDRSAESRPGGY